ncbi:O-antigen ligase domain-containing protein [Arthrobacter sp. 9V]|uniref:O-antigen ligase family protein n=1 Tax=Arthrobacter sp. 9V TaxID=2653132 RepID=UPI0012F1C4CF|nr:O-antigen ligase family protein [Arthrobacter sp. 9V]VXB29737.1 O-antigen ligase domain-containing protein [Arthrobacter sp. 9V]
MHPSNEKTNLPPGVSYLDTSERKDVSWFVIIYLFATCLFPSNLTLTALGSVGRPTTLCGLLAFAWWLLYQLQRTTPTRAGVQAVRIAMAIFLAVALTSYSLAMLHGVPDSEASPADSGLIRLASWAGIFLLINDGLSSRQTLIKVLRWLVIAGTATAALGLMQFVTGSSLVEWIRIPGFSAASELTGVQSRGGFVRAAGMASHPLEYGVVLAASLPIAIALAMTDRTKGRLLRWLPVAAISAAAVLSVSRSALMAFGVAVLALIPSWPKKVRLRAMLLGVVLAAGMYMLTPGMLGTLRGLFTVGTADPSINSRTSAYTTAFGMLANNPIAGRGFGTFLPDYVIVDNQFLGILVELGFVGLTAFVALILCAIICALRARRLATDDQMRQVSQAVLASITAIAVTFAFFDGLSFPMAASLFFFMLGIAGALWRLARQTHQTQPTRQSGAEAT